MSRVRWVLRELGPPLAGIAGALVVWAVVAAALDSPSLPSPLVVWSAFVDGVADGTIPEAALKTLIRLVFSFAVAVAVGITLGLLLALNGFARRAIRPLVVTARGWRSTSRP